MNETKGCSLKTVGKRLHIFKSIVRRYLFFITVQFLSILSYFLLNESSVVLH